MKNLLLLAVLTCLSFSVFASHNFSTEITYHCLSPGVYEFTLHKIRDCTGTPFPPTYDLTVHSDSCNIHQTVTFYADTFYEVSLVCAAMLGQTACSGGNLFGFEHHIYKDTLTLPPCQDWVIYFEACCRNNAITNLVQPGNANYYVETRLNNTVENCNNSPVLNVEAMYFTGLNHELFLSPGAYDVDGDSLHFELVNPMNGYNSSMSYIQPYSAQNPLGTSGGFHFDENTGQMRFTPNVLEVTFINIKISEFRNGNFLGSILRDFQVWVIPNSANPYYPEMQNAVAQNLSTIEIDSNCFVVNVGDTLNFGLFAIDLDPADSLSIWFYHPPGAQINSFSHQAFAGCTSDITWIPQQADIGHWYFTKRVHDNSCPNVGQGVRTVKVVVRENSICAAPADIWTTRLNTTSVVLVWDSVPGSHHYLLRGRPVGGTNWLYEVRPNFPFFFQANGLSPYTDYEWQMRTACSLTPGDTSNWTTLDTFRTGCYPVDSIWADPVTNYGARLNWNASNYGSVFEIRGRRVGVSFWTRILVPAPLSHKDVFGLQSNTTYEWTMRVWCDTAGTNVSTWYGLRTFTTANFNRKTHYENLRNFSESIKLFPNPAKATFNVSFSENWKLHHPEFRLYDLNGRICEVEIESVGLGQFTFSIAILNAGIYNLEIQTENEVVNRMLVVIR